MRHSNLTDEVLEQERVALATDKKLYLECMNNKPFSERHTIEEQHDGLIIFHMVYKFIKSQRIE